MKPNVRNVVCGIFSRHPKLLYFFVCHKKEWDGEDFFLGLDQLYISILDQDFLVNNNIFFQLTMCQ